MISKRHVFTVLEEKYRYDCKNVICKRRKIDLLAFYTLIKCLLLLLFFVVVFCWIGNSLLHAVPFALKLIRTSARAFERHFAFQKAYCFSENLKNILSFTSNRFFLFGLRDI